MDMRHRGFDIEVVVGRLDRWTEVVGRDKGKVDKEEGAVGEHWDLWIEVEDMGKQHTDLEEHLDHWGLLVVEGTEGDTVVVADHPAASKIQLIR